MTHVLGLGLCRKIWHEAARYKAHAGHCTTWIWACMYLPLKGCVRTERSLAISKQNRPSFVRLSHQFHFSTHILRHFLVKISTLRTPLFRSNLLLNFWFIQLSDPPKAHLLSFPHSPWLSPPHWSHNVANRLCKANHLLLPKENCASHSASLNPIPTSTGSLAITETTKSLNSSSNTKVVNIRR